MEDLPTELVRIIFADFPHLLPVCRRFLSISAEIAANCDCIYVTRVDNIHNHGIVRRIRPSPGGFYIGHSKVAARKDVHYYYTYGPPLHGTLYDHLATRIKFQHIIAEIRVRHRLKSSICKIRILRELPSVRVITNITTYTHVGLEEAITRARAIRILDIRKKYTVFVAKSADELYEKYPDQAPLFNYALCRSHIDTALVFMMERICRDDPLPPLVRIGDNIGRI